MCEGKEPESKLDWYNDSLAMVKFPCFFGHDEKPKYICGTLFSAEGKFCVFTLFGHNKMIYFGLFSL